MAIVNVRTGADALPGAYWSAGSGARIARAIPAAEWSGVFLRPAPEAGSDLTSAVQVGPARTWVFAGADVLRSIWARGTDGLMPDEWGIIQEAQESIEGSDFVRADENENVYAAGVTQIRHVVSFRTRLPVITSVPQLGDKFFFRGDTSRQFTVWASRTEWEAGGHRMVSVVGRWYPDLGNIATFFTTNRPPQLGG